MAALLDVVVFLMPVVGMLAAFAAVMAGVFLAVPPLVEAAAKRTHR